MNRLITFTIILVVAAISAIGPEIHAQNTDTATTATDTLSKVHTLKEVTIQANLTYQQKNKLSFIPAKKEKELSNGGYNLLYNMPIPVISVNPSDKTITTNMGDGVALFINGVPASPTEVQNIMSANVLKIEYLEQPSDPRFNNARYALNYVLQKYDRGGYTKIDAGQSFPESSGEYSGYSHYEAGKMTYDLFGGYKYGVQHHEGEEAGYDYNFEDLTISKEDFKSGRARNEHGFASLRAKYQSESTILANTLGMQVNRTPYKNMSGESILTHNNHTGNPLTFSTHEKDRNYGFEWAGNYFFRFGKGWDLTSDLTASFMNTESDYVYSIPDDEEIINNITENAWNIKLNTTLKKRFGPFAMGLNVISSINGNSIHYKGTTPADMNVRDWYVMPRIVFNINTGSLYLNGNIGVSYEEATYNGLREKYFFPKSFVSGNLNINDKNSIKASFEYSMFGNSLGMKSPNLIRIDELTAIQGNPKLKNFHFISPSISYNLIPSRKTSFNFFTRWQYFQNPTVYCWNPTTGEDGTTRIVRSYTNTGHLYNLRIGASGTVRLFDNSLMIKGSIAQIYFNQKGFTHTDCHPVSISTQINYFINHLTLSGYWEKSSRNVSIFDTKYTPQNYFISVTYGYRNFIASFRANNFFNSSWMTSGKRYNSDSVHYDIKNYGSGYHRSFVISLSYTISYGKKTNMKDRIRKSGIPSTAIIQ